MPVLSKRLSSGKRHAARDESKPIIKANRPFFQLGPMSETSFVTSVKTGDFPCLLMLQVLEHTLGRIYECLWTEICYVDVLNSSHSKHPLSECCRPPSLPSAMEKSSSRDGFRNIGGRGGRGGQQKTQTRQAEKTCIIRTAKSATYLLPKIVRLHNIQC